MYLKRQHFLVGANFLAAIGGGAILAAGQANRDACLPGPIIPFFVGAVIGLLFGKIVPNRFTRSIARWFSLTVALSSFILFAMAKTWCVNGDNAVQAVFFSLLSFRFGLWFFSRALRAQIVGSEKQGVALIEFGYYSGAVLGLLGWQWLGYSLPTAFLVDALIQTAAGIIDLVVIGSLINLNDRPAIARKEKTGHVFNFSHRHYLKLAVAVAALTVGFQGVWFSVAEAKWSSDEGKKYVMPCFYVGVALSALVSKGFKLKLDWDGLRKHSRSAVISSELIMLRLKPSFGLIVTLSVFTTIFGLFVLQWNEWAAYIPIFVIISAFSYQILVLSLLDRIGRDEHNENLTEEMIRETYIVAAVATLISIGLMENFARSYLWGWILTTGCCVISFLAVRRGGRAQV